MNRAVVRIALLLALGGAGMYAAPPAVRATLLSPKERQPAPDFALQDASGRTVTLKDYRGKVVLLDFWATWCHGCKEEIPWFSEFQKKFESTGLAVIGVSLDEGGWGVLKPFLDEIRPPYRMLLGNDLTAKRYNIESMPDTFLIDRRRRLAAAYKAGLVDKDDVERNLKTLLSHR